MGNRLYDLMDWPSIEGVVYSECDEPMELLGGRICKDGFLIQTFAPDAVEMNVRVDGRKKLYPMEKMDEAGFFAVLLPGRKKFSYTFVKEDIYGKKTEYKDIYSYGRQECMQALLKISQNGRSEYNINKFMTGSAQDAYKYMGSHEAVVDGISGMIFGIWAPDARRVSVIGAFNKWDGRVFQMEKDYDTGIFFLFIPDMKPKTPYCYEIKLKDGQVVKKADPYAQSASNDVIYASLAGVNPEEKNFKWTDADWKQEDTKHKPLSICEIDILDLKDDTIEDRIEALGFNCVEIMNVCAVRNGSSAETINFYAVNCEVGGLRLKAFIDKMHKKNISVIIDWNGAFMSQGEYSLVYFDGTHLYDTGKVNLDNHPELNVASFDYSKPQVRSFLMSNIRYWIEEYHVDGLKFSETASMLYLDYGRKPGEWIPNIYGGKENINAVEFIQNVRKMVDSLQKNTILAAEESSGWQFVTGDIADGGLGFDYKWNDGWKKELVPFIEMDPLFRKGIYGRLTYSMLYQYSDDFIIGFSRNGYGWKKGILKDIVPVNGEDVLNHVKTALGYMYFHPGKKLINIKECSGVEKFVAQMNNLYRNTKALYECDDNPSGFEWADDISAEETVIAVLRRDESGQSVIGAVNFTPVERKEFCIGVDEAGKYTDVLNDSVVYESSEHNWNSKDESVFVDLKPLGISLYTYEPYTEIEKERIKIEKETKEALMLAKKEADEAKAVKDAAIERAKQAKEAEIIALAAAKEAEKAEKEAAKKAEEARIACIKIDENAKKKLAELKKMEEKQGE
ncbi:GlgB N-terminal domain-containing protein [Lachnospira hominis (ex Liu et al. 2021)]|uniref:Alpha amylase C-terminal domain-containing protein n=1 Tax=Lachnospira hominis (ex Liu et al. 2021) TaxID=2763051 RepID=A0ABR7G160_9FIRM|nr:alpha amylase C-terminal domain-containing protein [Lachnospira hominis]MBC5681164.1 alpha amylase C-terminal domain-containing protein [Lachnospira hominis]